MIQIACPYCGLRDEHEFACGGEAHITRPRDPAQLSDTEWADYLFMRTNQKGVHLERWVHRDGCRKWFNVARNTITNDVLKVYGISELAPEDAGLGCA